MSLQRLYAGKQALSALTISLACVSAGMAFADAASDARKSIQALYDSEGVAISKLDVNATFRNYAPDYVSTDEKGQKKNLEQTKVTAAAVLGTMKSLKAIQKIQSLTLKSEKATVVVKTHVTGVGPKNSQTPQTFSGDDVTEDVWVKSGSGWLKKRSKTLSEKMTTSGVPAK